MPELEIVDALREGSYGQDMADNLLMARAAAEIERLRGALADAIDYIDPNTDPWIHLTAAGMVKRLRGYQQKQD